MLFDKFVKQKKLLLANTQPGFFSDLVFCLCKTYKIVLASFITELKVVKQTTPNLSTLFIITGRIVHSVLEGQCGVERWQVQVDKSLTPGREVRQPIQSREPEPHIRKVIYSIHA